MTPDPLSKLSRLQAICEAATPGPWFEDDGMVHSRPLADKVQMWIEGGGSKSSAPKPQRETMVAECLQGSEAGGLDEFQENADFIAASRTALPVLLEFLSEEYHRHSRCNCAPDPEDSAALADPNWVCPTRKAAEKALAALP